MWSFAVVFNMRQHNGVVQQFSPYLCCSRLHICDRGYLESFFFLVFLNLQASQEFVHSSPNSLLKCNFPRPQ